MAFPDTDLTVIIKAYMGADPTAAPGTWPAPVDLSSRLLDVPIRITRGRSRNQRTLSSGSCSFELSNFDGALTPLLAISPYYGQWDLGTPVSVAVDGVGASPPYKRFCGYVASIEQTVTPGSAGQMVSTVRVTLGGVLRRITQGAVARSPLRRAILPPGGIPGVSVVGYWPLEQGITTGMQSGNTPLAARPADLAITFPGGVVESVAGPGGSDGATSLKLDAATAQSPNANPFVASFPVTNFNDLVLSVCVRVQRSDTPGIGKKDLSGQIQITGGFGSTGALSLDFSSDPTAVSYHTYIDAGLFSTFPEYTGVDPADGVWRRLTGRFTRSGSDVLVKLYIDGTLQASATATGRAGDLDLLSAVAIKNLWSGSTSATGPIEVAHLVIADGFSTALTSGTIAQGYPGEQAHVRFSRICNEDGLPNTTTATASRLVGPQPITDTVAILRDLEAVDHGVLYELPDDWGFGYRAARQRYSIPAALTVDLSTYRVSDESSSDVLTPIRSDQRTRNEWTISRPNGGTAAYKDAAHQAKHGRYNDSAEVNVNADTDLEPEARWRVHEGTYTEEQVWQDICRHEAGHVVVAAALGVEIHSVHLDRAAGKGRTITRPCADPWAEAMVCMAGTAAVSDYSEADQTAAVQAIGAGRIPEAISEARLMLLPRWEWVEIIARALYGVEYLSGERVSELLEGMPRAALVA